MNNNEKPNNLFNSTVQSMFQNHNRTLDRAVSARSSGGKKAVRKDLELALTVLLVQLASSDQNFDAQEHALIQKGLCRVFGTNKQEVSGLIHQAQGVLANLRGTGQFATTLKDNLSEEQRTAVMQIIDDLIASDGVEDGYETYLRHKFMDLLGITQ